MGWFIAIVVGLQTIIVIETALDYLLRSPSVVAANDNW